MDVSSYFQQGLGDLGIWGGALKSQALQTRRRLTCPEVSALRADLG